MDRPGPPDGGYEYPFVNPTPDISGKLTDFHLSYDGDPAVLPLRIARLDGIGQYWESSSSTSRESSTSTFGRPELIIVDGNNTVILDTRSVPAHRTRSWGSYVIHEWSGDGVICFAAAPPASESGMPERMEPDSAVLDERTWYQPKRRVKKLIVDGQELTGKVTLLGGYNTVISPTTGTLGAARSVIANVSPFSPSQIFISAEAGSGEGRYPDCSDDNPPLRRINGQTADPSNNITVSGKDCVIVTQPMTYNLDTVTPAEGSITISDSCGPCCDCSDYEKVAIGMRRLWVSFADIGIRAGVVRDKYRTIRDRMVTAQECVTQNPLRILAFASKNRVVDLNFLLCNNTGSCKYGVRIIVTFVHTRRRVGIYDDLSYYASDPDTGQLIKYPAPTNFEISGVFWPYPEFYHQWPYLRPNQIGRIRMRLQFEEFRAGDELAIDATNTIAGTYGPATASAIVQLRK